MADTSGYKRNITGAYIVKDPGATLEYTVDWSEWLNTGTEISTSAFAISTISGDAAPVTNGGDSIVNTNQCVVELSGGTSGNIYTITNTITTDNAETDVRRFQLVVEERYLV